MVAVEVVGANDHIDTNHRRGGEDGSGDYRTDVVTFGALFQIVRYHIHRHHHCHHRPPLRHHHRQYHLHHQQFGRHVTVADAGGADVKTDVDADQLAAGVAQPELDDLHLVAMIDAHLTHRTVCPFQ